MGQKDALTTAVELEAFQTANIQRSQANTAVVPHAQTAAAASPVDEKYVAGHNGETTPVFGVLSNKSEKARAWHYRY